MKSAEQKSYPTEWIAELKKKKKNDPYVIFISFSPYKHVQVCIPIYHTRYGISIYRERKNRRKKGSCISDRLLAKNVPKRNKKYTRRFDADILYFERRIDTTENRIY